MAFLLPPFDGLRQVIWRFNYASRHKPGHVVVLATSVDNAREQFTERFLTTKSTNPDGERFLREIDGWTSFEGPYTYLSQTMFFTPKDDEDDEVYDEYNPGFVVSGCHENPTYYKTLLALIQNEQPTHVFPITNIIVGSALDG